MIEVCLGHLCDVYLRWNKCYLYSIPQTLTTSTPRLYLTSTIYATSRLSCPPKHASNRRNFYLEVETPLLLPCKVWVDLSTTRHDNRFEAPFLHWLAQVQDSHNFSAPRSLSTKKKLWVRFFTQIIPKKNCVVFYNTLGTSQFRSPIGGKVATESSPFFGRFSTTGISKCVLSTAHTRICVHTMDTIHLQSTKMQKDDISDPSLRPLLSKEGQTENPHFHGA